MKETLTEEQKMDALLGKTTISLEIENGVPARYAFQGSVVALSHGFIQLLANDGVDKQDPLKLALIMAYDFLKETHPSSLDAAFLKTKQA